MVIRIRDKKYRWRLEDMHPALITLGGVIAGTIMLMGICSISVIAWHFYG